MIFNFLSLLGLRDKGNWESTSFKSKFRWNQIWPKIHLWQLCCNAIITSIINKKEIYSALISNLTADIKDMVNSFGTLRNEKIDVPDRGRKNQLLVAIFSLSLIWLNKFVQQELKQRHSDSLCETKVFHQARHQTSGCHSWSLGFQTHCFSSLLTVWEKLWESQVWTLRAVKVLGLHLKELFSPGCKFDISSPSRMNFVSKIKVNFFSPFCL